MADDQKPKSMDINDLVRELSKSSTSPGTSSAPQVNRPSFPTPKPPAPPAPSSPPTATPSPLRPPEVPKPQFSTPPSFNKPLPSKPAPLSSAPSPAPTPTPGVKEYQSLIRTMNEDISKVKQGQKPTGIEVPRKIEQVVPVPQPIPPKPAPPAGGPSQQFKVPSVNLGEAQKTGPLAQSKDFSKPPTTPKVEPKPQIYVPQEGQKGGNRNMLFIGIGIIVIVAGFSYWFFVLRSLAPPEVVVKSPTPIPTATPIQNLNTIFASAVEIEPLAPINGGEFRKDSKLFKTPGLKPKLLEIIESIGSKYPLGLSNVLGNDGAVFWYGQKELFDSKGQLKVGVLPERNLTIINEIIDTEVAPQVISSWESSMSEDLKLLTATDKSPGYKGPKVKEFLDNNYRGVGIRYKNFSHPDKSIDYAVVSGFNGRNYLVITGSREAMYATIDKLKGL